MESNEIPQVRETRTRSNKPLVIVIAIAVISVSVVGILMHYSFEPTLRQDNMHPENEYKNLETNLAKGLRINLESPDRTRWDRGSTGRFQLGIKNQYQTQETFYTSIALAGLEADLAGMPVGSFTEETKSWFSYHPDSLSLSPDEKGMVNIGLSISDNAAKGYYLFDVTVCEHAACEKSVSSIYDKTRINIYVK